MDLKGHRSQIMTAAFSPDNKRAVTASKDLTLRVWNIDVRYTLSEDPKTLVGGGLDALACIAICVQERGHAQQWRYTLLVMMLWAVFQALVFVTQLGTQHDTLWAGLMFALFA